jgi:hypothetical protein
MAALVLKMSVSLDGFVAPVDGSTDWVAAGRSDDAMQCAVETVRNASAHLVGAATYAEWATFRLYHASLTIDQKTTTVFGGGAVAHVFAAHP